MVSRPVNPGWFWFLPAVGVELPDGLRVDQPKILCVYSLKVTRDGEPSPLVVQLPGGIARIDTLTGDWAAIHPPKDMLKEATRRWSRTAQPTYDELVAAIVGKTVAEANDFLKPYHRYVRVMQIDGRNCMGTGDLVPNRMDVVVASNKITKVI